MTIRYRPMRRKDVRECVDIVGAHPIVGPRYASATADLREAWSRLLAGDGFCAATVFEEKTGARVNVAGVGVSVFVSDEFLREAKKPPSFWIGPELAKRVARGDHTLLLSSKQVREANSREGLNLVIWQATVREQHMQRVEVWDAFMRAGVEQHRGYRLKELLVAQAESVEHLMGLRHTGGFFWDGKNQRYGDLPDCDLHAFIREPHVAGITREIALSRPLESITSSIGSLFLYEPPQFGFSGSEQRLLLSALVGGTDEELSDELGISVSTVKKTWRSVYDRVAKCMPELIPGNSQPDGEASKRGKDKKQRLISYLREHPQELRPVSRKLQQQQPARTRHLP
jgi:DNA-binding CsgD family transcriptional regulator